MRDNGYEGIYLELQQMKVQETKRIADSIVELTAAAQTLAVQLRTLVDALSQEPTDPPEGIWPPYDN